MHSVQQHLQRSDIALSISAQDSHEPVPVTISFHRVKARLPTDEIQYILSTVHDNAGILQHEHEQHVWYLRSLGVQTVHVRSARSPACRCHDILLATARGMTDRSLHVIQCCAAVSNVHDKTSCCKMQEVNSCTLFYRCKHQHALHSVKLDCAKCILFCRGIKSADGSVHAQHPFWA